MAAVRATVQEAGGVLAVDLGDLPDLAGLTDPAEAGDFSVIGWERWGDLPVALIGTGPGVPMRSADLAALSAVLPSASDSASAQDKARVSRQRVAVRTQQLNRSRTHNKRLHRRLEARQATLSVRTKERDRARKRVSALENSREMRWGRRATSTMSRIPGGRRGLVGAAVLALLLLVLTAVLVALWPRVGLAVAAVLALLGIAGAAALHLLLAVRAGGRARPVVAPTARRPSATRTDTPSVPPTAEQHAELLDHLRRLQIEVGDSRNTLAAIRSTVQREPERRVITAAASRAQLQATTQLFSMFSPEHRVPPMGGWAASPDLVLALIDELRRVRPALVVECGSGVSTLWLALAIRKYGLDTRIVSLDHDAHFGAMTIDTLEQHGVADIAEVRIAPLVDVGLPGHGVAWYDPSGWQDLRDIGLLVVDGPPAATGPGVRYPALPLLVEKLAPTTSVVLDDMIRADEQGIVKQWQALLPELERIDIPLEKRATILRRQG